MLQNTGQKSFHMEHAPDDDAIIRHALDVQSLSGHGEAAALDRSRRLIEGIRASSSSVGGVEDFLREYGLSTREGLALMVLAEALLRVPDGPTQDRLIEDKLHEGGWSTHEAHGDTMFVAASAWALGMSARVLRPGETPEGVVSSTLKRLGLPTVRMATKQAMRFLGGHFVLGETIGDALKRARGNRTHGYRHSYDMLGEGARTHADAARYFKSYADAIDAIGAANGGQNLPEADGISVKLSALHPRYLPTHRDIVLNELVPSVLDLARKAKAYGLNFTVDAEEADRLELSLDVIDAVFADPSLDGWDGFGLAVQAYQKRALAVIEHVHGLCMRHDRRMMVRLVKGAYWDTEIKRAQERGLDGFPVFTRKAATDVNYLACARRMLGMRDRIFPQFATHNANTVARIVEMAGADLTGFEFQRLHGMGDALYKQVSENGPNNSAAIGKPLPCRVYAPVGGYRDLLAYLVRRLLENGANSSFVAQAGDPDVPVDDIIVPAHAWLNDGQGFTHPLIVKPEALFAPRPNSKGVNFGDRIELAELVAAARPQAPLAAADEGRTGERVTVLSPANPEHTVGIVRFASVDDVNRAMAGAKAAHHRWSRLPVGERATCLSVAADALETQRDRFIHLLVHEAGKTFDDAIAEIREAVDFLRYYGCEANRLFAGPVRLPGPVGEDNSLQYRGRGVFGCISPWNFPLAIFVGQISAALAAGNCVIAKPAHQTPLTALAAVELLHGSGIPHDVLVCLPGAGDIGAAVVGHVDIAGIAFTGSTATAQRINRALAEKDGPIVPLIAETGGLNAMIVDATALPEQVADDAVMSAFRSAGQRCSALRLLFVQDSVADRMIEMIEGAARALKVGDTSCSDTDIGPIIDDAQKSMLEDHVAAMAKVGRVKALSEVPASGHFFAPHIVELSEPSHLKREVFGPVLHVVRWSATELDAVVKCVAESGYGLTFGLHTRIAERIARVTEALDVGNIYVNRNTIGAIVGSQPFGGSGLSGTGPKAGGPNYLLRFAHEQVISNNTAAAGGNASLLALGGM